MKEDFPSSWKDLDELAPRWKRGQAEHACDAIIFDVERIPSVSPTTGKSFDFIRLNARDWVNVIALTPERKLIMVVQQRHGIDRATMEIPAGLVDSGEAPAHTALRELEEETGYVPSDLVHIGTVYPNPAFLNNMCHTYLATDCCPTGTVRRDSSEEIEVVLIEWEQVPSLMMNGLLGNAMGLAGLQWYDLYLRGYVWCGDSNMEVADPLPSRNDFPGKLA